MHYDEFDYEEQELQSKMSTYIIITIITIVLIIAIVIIVGIVIRVAYNNNSKKNRHVLYINEKNKPDIIKIYEQENQRLEYNPRYCDSMTKIEFYVTFTNGAVYTIYCKDQDDIHFEIEDVEKDNLTKYVDVFGYIENG